MTTVQDCYEALKSWFGAGVRPSPPDPNLFGLQYMITLLYRYVWTVEPDLLGGPDSEPRKTWDAGGTIEEGYVKMWNE